MNKNFIHNSEEIDSILDLISEDEHDIVRKRMLLAAIIKDAMDKKKISKKKFAELMGKSPSMITRWLSGTHNFTIDTLFEIERKLCVSLVNIADYSDCHVNVTEVSISANLDDNIDLNKEKICSRSHFVKKYSANLMSNSANSLANE